MSRVVSVGIDVGFEERVVNCCNKLEDLLISKNLQYGNSALEPLRVFSQTDTAEQLRVRIDDKLSRILRGKGQETEDTIFDLLGYLILLAMALDLA
jgi:hypothetical protein